MSSVKRGQKIRNYKVIDFIRLSYDIYSYQVEDIDTRELYTLKAIELELTAPESLVSFVNETRILASIDHPLFLGFVETFVLKEEKVMW